VYSVCGQSRGYFIASVCDVFRDLAFWLLYWLYCFSSGLSVCLSLHIIAWIKITENHDISEMREHFEPNFAHLFRGHNCTKIVTLCAVFTWRTPNSRKRKLQERILQLCTKSWFYYYYYSNRVPNTTFVVMSSSRRRHNLVYFKK